MDGPPAIGAHSLSCEDLKIHWPHDHDHASARFFVCGSCLLLAGCCLNQGGFVAIEHAARRARENIEAGGCLSRFLGPDVTLVPMPRSSLIKEGSLWPAMVICEALQDCGIGGSVLPCLSRAEAIGKAALAAPGRRPGPPEHYRTIRVEPIRPLDAPRALVLVDDIVTRGSSFVGVLPHLTETFPGTRIDCFALLRTVSQGEIASILDPVAGRITYRHGHLHRDP